jgi:hypothetical protein
MIFDGEAVKRATLTLGFGALLVMSTLGIVYSGMSMSMGGGKMSYCPLMSGSNVCPMSALEHAALMQSIFTNIPQQQDATILFILAISIMAAIGIGWFRSVLTSAPFKYSGFQYRYKERLILRAIQELFSNGILNPKPY